MGKEFSRARRVGELLQRELAEVIRRELREPGVGMVTVSHVDVAPDFKRATVMVTHFGGSMSEKDLLALLNDAAPDLRHYLAREVNLRSTPKLSFSYDHSVEQGAHLSALINSVIPPKPDED